MENKNQNTGVQKNQSEQKIELLEREKLNVVGAIEVLSATDKEATIKLDGCYLCVTGSGISIVKLVPEEKFLSLSGHIDGINYISKLTKKSFFGKVFK